MNESLLSSLVHSLYASILYHKYISRKLQSTRSVDSMYLKILEEKLISPLYRKSLDECLWSSIFIVSPPFLWFIKFQDLHQFYNWVLLLHPWACQMLKFHERVSSWIALLEQPLVPVRMDLYSRNMFRDFLATYCRSVRFWVFTLLSKWDYRYLMYHSVLFHLYRLVLLLGYLFIS